MLPYKAQQKVLPALYWLRAQSGDADMAILDTVANLKGVKDTLSAGSIIFKGISKDRAAYTFNPLHRYLNHHDSPLLWNVLINWDHLSIR